VKRLALDTHLRALKGPQGEQQMVYWNKTCKMINEIKIMA
jgi:hypothetical protein